MKYQTEVMEPIESLFAKDGWCEIARSFDDELVLVLCDSGAIQLRYISWDFEQEDIFSTPYHSVNFFFDESCTMLDDSLRPLMIARELPRRTDSTIEAERLLAKLHYDYEHDEY